MTEDGKQTAEFGSRKAEVGMKGVVICYWFRVSGVSVSASQKTEDGLCYLLFVTGYWDPWRWPQASSLIDKETDLLIVVSYEMLRFCCIGSLNYGSNELVTAGTFKLSLCKQAVDHFRSPFRAAANHP